MHPDGNSINYEQAKGISDRGGQRLGSGITPRTFSASWTRVFTTRVGNADELEKVLQDMFKQYGKPLWVQLKATQPGYRADGTLERPRRSFWYACVTTKYPLGHEGRELTPASDIYSLGLVMYQMVAAAKVFADQTPLVAALRRLKETPPPPSQINPELGTVWDAVVARCLDPDPAKRIRNARELQEALNATPGFNRRASSRDRAIKARRWPVENRLWAVYTVAGAVLLTIGWGLALHSRHKAAPATNLSIVLAEFVNTTGEPVFDRTLNVALSAKLQQTPFLTVMPDLRIRQALRYMGLQPNERLTEAIASQVCQREGGQVVLQGSIANAPQGYDLTLRAVQCHSGELLASKQTTVENRDSVLDALDQVADAVRPILGESIDSLGKYNVTVSEATTGSLEALVAYTEGEAVWNAQGENAATPYFQRAARIDPNFAMAYERLGTIYANRGDSLRSQDAVRKAWELRNRVTERERFHIVSHYYGFVTGEIDKEMSSYLDWSKVYPHDLAWMIDLSVDYGFLGQFDKAIELQNRVIQENPGISFSYGDLSGFYLAEERPDEAQAVLEQASQAHLQDPNTQLAEYYLAFYRRDLGALDRLLAATAHQPGIEDVLLAEQAMTEDSLGRIGSGRWFALRAAAVATAAQEPEIEANWLTSEAARQAEMGDRRQARLLLAKAMSIPAANRGRNALVWAAQTHALLGDARPMENLIGRLNRDYPLDTLVQSYWMPILRASLAFANAQYDQALRLTASPSPYDLGIVSPGQCMDEAFVRGQALLADHQSAAAAAEFRGILAHRGLVLNCATAALAQLGLARALVQGGDSAAGRMAYQDLFALWKDADKNLTPLLQARAEYRGLR